MAAHHSPYGKGAVGASVFGTGVHAPMALYGTGSHHGGYHTSTNYATTKLDGGMLPGECVIPESKMHEAVHHYKTMKNLHSPHYPHHHLPHLHPLHIMEQHLHHDGVRGGMFPILPLLAGAAVPLIGEAVKGLIGGFANKSGSHLADRIQGRGLHIGLPMPFHHAGQRHFHIHGAGFKDLLKRAMMHAKNIFTSQPARKLGAHAINAIKEAFMHAITEKINGLETKIMNRVAPKIEERAIFNAPPDFEGLGPTRPSAQHEDHEDMAEADEHPAHGEEAALVDALRSGVTGYGLRRRRPPTRRRRATAPKSTGIRKRVPPRKRKLGVY